MFHIRRILSFVLILTLVSGALPLNQGKTAFATGDSCAAGVSNVRSSCSSGGITQTSPDFDWEDPAFQDVIRKFPSFLKLDDDFLPDVGRERMPMSITKQSSLFRCGQDPLAEVLNPLCEPGTTVGLMTFVFGAGKNLKVKSVPFPKKPSNKKPGKDAIRKALEKVSIFAIVTGLGHMFYDCYITEESLYCDQTVEYLNYGDDQASVVWNLARGVVDEVRRLNLAASIAASGGTAVLARNGYKRALVYTSGADNLDGTYQINKNSFLMDVAAHWNKPQGRVYVPLRFINEAVGAGVSAPQHCDNGGRNCVLTPTIKFQGNTVEFPLDKDYYLLNDKKVSMEGSWTYLDQKSERTMVPVRFALQALGYQVFWYEDTEEILFCKGGALCVEGS